MRLIDADALKEELNNWAVDLTKSKFPHYIKDDADCIIDNAPTIAALPVRHGMWEPYSIEPEAYDIAGVKSWAKKYRCSECGFLHTVIEDFGIYTFCPNCGAKMDKEDLDRWRNEQKATGKY